MSNQVIISYNAIDPKTGAVLRPATPAEIKAFMAQPCHLGLWAFRKATLVGSVLVDDSVDAGPNNQPYMD